LKKFLILLVLVVLPFVGCSGDRDDEMPVPVHPALNLTRDELSATLTGMPEDIQLNILEKPEYFLELVLRLMENPQFIYVQVDKDNALSDTYVPENLVPLTEYDLTLNRNDLLVRREIMPDVLAMTEAARQQGVELLFSSAYRSYEYQAEVFKRHVDELGEEQARRESAEPGKSQHQLGTAIDFGSITDEFAYTPAGKWLKENAWKYGFSLSYPKGHEDLTGYRHECWHFRYISRTGTELEQKFFMGIQHYLLSFLKENRRYLEDRIIQK
jgi:D-alanyl-D-alanine carboxypeptidase